MSEDSIMVKDFNAFKTSIPEGSCCTAWGESVYCRPDISDPRCRACYWKFVQ